MKSKAICLISDGIDSPVATFLISQKNIEVIGIHFDNKPMIAPVKKYASKQDNLLYSESEKQIHNIAQQLVNSFETQTTFDLYTVPNGEELRIIKNSDDPKLTCILCKRLMVRKAEVLAEQIDADYIVTGEILGEQASQTIDNLSNIQDALREKQLIRPIIGINKDEITIIARKIGTMPFSEKASKFTCTAVPNRPAISAQLERIYRLENKLEIEKFIEISVRKAKKTVFKKN
jgi:thiamine biosynthesis protein ThiI